MCEETFVKKNPKHACCSPRCNSKKKNEKLKQENKIKLQSISRICKSDNCNNIFSPTKEQLEKATSHIEVFEKARKLGQGQVDFDGIRIEMPTYLNALEVIKRFNELKQFN